MAITMLDQTPAVSAQTAVEPLVPALAEPVDLVELVAEATRSLARAAQARVDGLDDQALGRAVAGLSGLESRAVALRMALALTHHTCAIAGCTRPFAWCETHHHHIGWATGGATDLDNGLPLCGWHHHKAHDPQLDLRQRPDSDWTLHRRT